MIKREAKERERDSTSISFMGKSLWNVLKLRWRTIVFVVRTLRTERAFLGDAH